MVCGGVPAGPVPRATGPATAVTGPLRRSDWRATTPIWLLDVDGVLNAATGSPDPGVWNDYRSGWATAQGSRWRIMWSPTVVRTIVELHTARAVEVLWLTTWEDDANGDLVELLQMPTLPVAGRSADVSVDFADGWWKQRIAQRIHEQDPSRQILWTDDDLTYYQTAARWIRGRGLGVSPDTAHGLDRLDLQRIRAFVDDAAIV